MRENQVLLINEKEQTRTITWEKKQTRTHTWQKKQECVAGGTTVTRWVDVSSTDAQWIAQSTTETRWVACEWEDISPPETRNREVGEWTDTDRIQQDPVDDSWEKEQTRTVTWEKKQQCTGGGDTSYQWVNASRTETQWVVIPEECGPWSDTGQTTVSSYGTYSRTGRTRGSGASKECEESRTNQRQKQQKCTTNAPYNNTRYQWVGTTSATQKQWVSCPDPCGPWEDTGEIRVSSYGTYSRTGSTRGSGMNRECQESRTNQREKEQSRMCDNIEENRWVSTTSATQTRWVSCPVCDEWSASGKTRNRVTGAWTDTGSTSGCGPNRDKRQSKTDTWQYEETRECPGGTQSRWRNDSSTQYRWVDSPEPLRWGNWTDVSPSETRNRSVGSWTDTGRTREDPITFVVEYEQQRTVTWQKKQQSRSHCNTYRYQWVSDSTTETRWEPETG